MAGRLTAPCLFHAADMAVRAVGIPPADRTAVDTIAPATASRNCLKETIGLFLALPCSIRP